MKNLILAFTALASMGVLTAEAQEVRFQDSNLFNHLDLNLTAGTTGVGVELRTPIGNYVKLRAGFSAMPRFDLPTKYNIQVGDDPKQSKSKFDRLSKKLSAITGQPVDSKVEAVRQLVFWNWNVLVDVYPFKQNKHWHVTGGFYYGPSKVAEAYNSTESMQTLMAVNIYNNMYERVISSPVLTDRKYFITHNTKQVLQDIQVLRDLGIIDVDNLPDELNQFGLDPEDNFIKRTYERIANYGRMGVNMGKYSRDIVDEQGNVIHKQGDTYFMEPDENSMVKATMHVNRFKPYAGFGYEGRLVKRDDRYHISFDCGVMFWGGTPELKTHDGTDLIHDVEDVPGRIGSNVRMIEKFKVFPVLNIKFTRKLF